MKNPLSLILYPLSRLSRLPLLFLCLAFAGLFPTAAPADELSRGLVGWWRFDGNLTDASGNGNHGTVGAGSAAYAAGVYGQAFDCNSANVFSWRAGQTITPEEIGDELTVVFWAFQAVSGTGYVVCANQNNNGQSNTHLFSVLNTGGEMRFSAYGLANAGQVVSVTLNAWTMYGMTATKNGTLKWYKNGEKIGEVACGDRPSANNAGWGARSNNNDFTASAFFFNGLLDNGFVYNRALSPSEIKTLYALGSPIGAAP